MTDTGAPLADFSRSSRPICAGGSSRLIGTRAAPVATAIKAGIGVNRRREIITGAFRSA